MLRDLFDKGKCRVGLHAGSWSYLRPGSCEQERTCSRCGDRSTRVTHEWGPFLASPDDPCRQQRRCARCPVQESTVEHAWEDPQYADDGDCRRVRPCARCGIEEPAPTAHVLDRWSYVGLDDCTQAVGCSRCGVPGTGRRRHHDWAEWAGSAFYGCSVCVCRHCGEMVLGAEDDPGDPDEAPSFTEGYRAVWGLLEAPDPAALRQRVEAQPDVLLGPVAPRCLAFIADQVAGSDDDREAVRSHIALLDRCRTEGLDAVFGTVEPPPVETAPPMAGHPPMAEPVPVGMQGHWRHTELLGAGTPMSMMIETHLVLDASGRFAWWSSPDNREGGRWSATDGTLALSFDDGSRSAWRYQREGSNMIFPDDSRYRFWQRA